MDIKFENPYFTTQKPRRIISPSSLKFIAATPRYTWC